MKITLHLTKVLLFFLGTFSMFAQENTWEISEFRNGTNDVTLEHLDSKNYMVFQLNIENLKQQLLNAPHRKDSNGQSNTIVQFPNFKGELESYRVVETAIFSSEYGANAFPNIKTYLGSRIDNSGTRLRFSVTPLGLKAMISEPGKDPFYIQPVTKVSNGQYLIYNRAAKVDSSETFECLTEDLEVLSRTTSTPLERDANDQLLRTFRIAISTTSQYTAFWNDGNAGNGNAQEDALAQMISTLNRVNEVFEVDMAITFQLVNTANDLAIDLVYSGTDPYGNDLNGDLQDNLTDEVGELDYDIGHLFHYDDNNGNAGCIGCVCENGEKGSGFSSHLFEDNDGGPFMADFFDIDYVPHEMGHQMGANHTWSFGSEGTGVNAEPGSGTSIMGYAGITGSDDVQDHSDPYFHYYSIFQILGNVASSPNNCATTTSITNSPPDADAGIDYTIPNGTAFVLKGSATDANGSDVLTYCWEQIDDGVTTDNNFGPTKTSGALWRSRPPSTSPDRYMPIFERVLNGELTETNPVETVDNSSWETVSTVGRDLNFALTVRDRSEAGGIGQTPQSNYDTMTVTVDNTSGPFVVTSQTTNESWDAGTSQTITWDVAGTDTGNVNTPTVNILLSVDGGQTFPFTMATNVPNDGSHDVTVPFTGGDTSMARVIVEGSDNIFYAVNSSNFSIQASEFILTVDTTELDICQPNSLVYNFTYNTFLGFSNTTNFSVTGLPAGASAVINPTSATADGTLGTITINGTGSLTVGSYPFTFDGTSGTASQDVDLIMNVYSDSVNTAILTSPNNGAANQSTAPELMWTGSDNVQDYLVEVATDINFTNIVDSGTTQSLAYTVGDLNTNSTYYWRVTASNLCDTAPVSSVFSFTTANISCNSFLDDVPQNISEFGSGNTVVSTINIGQDLLVTDVNVTVNITHTWTDDLEITLTSPSGTVVDLIFDEGDDGDDLINTTFDQEGVDGPITGASPPFTGSFLPEGDLSTIYGETSGGDWVLTIVDDANQDGGTFNSFSLYLCLEGTLSVGEENSSLSDFVIYPNPNKGTFNVVFNNSNSDNVKISVFDIRGRQIFNNIYDGSPTFNQSVSLENAQSGVYLVTVENGTNKVTKRVIID
ncbi:zinc-dependent metalloprotease [Psychroserpens ponticola]|uniref:M12 family metallo-peptidase n=1 Tax=Psychroserpens ponticola TaxID=2932268 RepID=A0ABY7RYW1_9FLAO|nr:zinc-dependent metalloprotease family protein [Psychroserpens ponticola]WCO01922.1 M12 family metallo-peptidase [Psychroserpens ponticola]